MIINLICLMIDERLKTIARNRRPNQKETVSVPKSTPQIIFQFLPYLPNVFRSLI